MCQVHTVWISADMKLCMNPQGLLCIVFSCFCKCAPLWIRYLSVSMTLRKGTNTISSQTLELVCNIFLQIRINMHVVYMWYGAAHLCIYGLPVIHNTYLSHNSESMTLHCFSRCLEVELRMKELVTSQSELSCWSSLHHFLHSLQDWDAWEPSNKCMFLFKAIFKWIYILCCLEIILCILQWFMFLLFVFLLFLVILSSIFFCKQCFLQLQQHMYAWCINGNK